jgi:hypothetical protein
MGRMKIQGQPMQKISETPISTNKLDGVAHTSGPSYLGGMNRRTEVQPGPGRKNLRSYLKTN